MQLYEQNCDISYVFNACAVQTRMPCELGKQKHEPLGRQYSTLPRGPPRQLVTNDAVNCDASEVEREIRGW